MVRKKKIVLILSAGLGNRMRVIASSIQYAKKHNRSVWIVWPKNSALGCGINDIFENIGINYKVPNKFIKFLLTQLFRHGVIRNYFKIYKRLFKILSIDSVFDDDMKYDNQPQMEINSNKTVLITTCYAFGSDQDYKLFRFTDYIKNEVEKEYQKINGPYIGIHIRRTDHIDVIKHSPLENYLTQINKCILENPSQKFFLATDDGKTKEYLSKKYGERFYTINHKLGRGDLAGIQGAVIELLLLSKSSIIICSALSSYSDTAILLGNIKYIINIDKKLDKINLENNVKLNQLLL